MLSKTQQLLEHQISIAVTGAHLISDTDDQSENIQTLLVTSTISKARAYTSFADYVNFFWAEHSRWLSSGSGLGNTLSVKLTYILCNSEIQRFRSGFSSILDSTPVYNPRSRFRRLDNMKLVRNEGMQGKQSMLENIVN